MLNKLNTVRFNLVISWGLILWFTINPNLLITNKNTDIVLVSIVLGLTILDCLLDILRFYCYSRIHEEH